jgi:hypothetical protein
MATMALLLLADDEEEFCSATKDCCENNVISRIYSESRIISLKILLRYCDRIRKVLWSLRRGAIISLLRKSTEECGLKPIPAQSLLESSMMRVILCHLSRSLVCWIKTGWNRISRYSFIKH